VATAGTPTLLGRGVVPFVLRLADLVAGLSRLADLGFGLPAGDALRCSALAVLLARDLDLPDDDVRAALYTGLLHHVGCVGFAREAARAFGDEHRLNVAAARTNLADPRDLISTLLPMLTRGEPPRERARLVLTTLARGQKHGVANTTAACEVGRDAARRLGLPEEVQRGIYTSYELWNGKGVPDGLAGEDIPIAARLTTVATAAALFDTIGGVETAVEVVRGRSGGMLDPELCERFAGRAEALLGEVNGADPYRLVLDAEPRPVASVLDPQLVDVAHVFADLADVKTPYTHGHSRAVAALARDAGRELGCPPSDVADLELAGLLHDVGRVAVSSAVWDKPGSLTADQWEQVRLHAYHSERILAGSERLAPLATLVGAHHERCDGGGYHRGSTCDQLPMPARVLAAADAYQAITQPRPHRAALVPEEAEKQLLEDARAGVLDADAVTAVLAAAGHEAAVARPEPPAGLTDREVEVLGLVARGRTNREVAEALVISRRTAEHHVQNIYAKIGASSRAAAALFAMEHDLIPRANA
jgi:HD-GYP domain-containing protein (c-di-GMP phosphodiesterase class II)